MRAAVRRVIIALVVGVCAVSALVASRAAADTIEVTVEGVRSSRGQILIALHDTPSGFPGRWSGAVAIMRVPANQRPVAAAFRDAAPGDYAVIAVHDEDGDGQMTKSFIGFPQEGFGVSNNPTFLGPPRFGRARFSVDGLKRVTIRMVYP